MGGFVYVLGPCGPLPWTLLWSWEFLSLPQLLQIFTYTGFESLVSQAETLGSAACLASQWFFPAHQPTNVGPTGPPATSLAVCPLRLRWPSPPLLPVWMNVFFNSLVVGLPWSLNIWQFWLFFVFKFAVVLLLVVWGSEVFLPMSSSWLALLGCFLQIRGVSIHVQIPKSSFSHQTILPNGVH